jgi:hypothetical protein
MEKLIKGAEMYFKDSEDLQFIYASPDGQYFYEEGQCLAYCVNHKLDKPLRIERTEAEAEVEAEAEEIKAPKKQKNGSIKKSSNK